MVKNILKQTIQFLVIIVVVSFVVDLWRGQSLEKQLVPKIQGMSLTNEWLDIDAISQKEPVLVYFWGSWCPVCQFVSPSVDTLSAYYPVVTIAMDSGDNATLSQYLRTKALNFEVINDQHSKIARNLGVNITPLVMIVDQGELVGYTTGYVSLFGMWWRMTKAQWF